MKIQQFNDYALDVVQSILWQYNEATNLLGLVTAKQQWYDLYQSAFWGDTFQEGIFNLTGDDISQFGLAVWSIILNVPLFVPEEEEDPNKPVWGFNHYAPSYPTLYNSYWNFYGNSDHSGANFSVKGQEIILTPEEQQFLLQLRYYQLITSGAIAHARVSNTPGYVVNQNNLIIDINDFLNYLCTNNRIDYSGTIYALDGLDMTMVYVFTAANFPDQLLEAITELDLFPRPAGVGIRYVVNTGTIWGFGYFNQNFGHGNFAD